MIKISVKKNNEVVQFVNFETQESADAWVQMLANTAAWGLPERAVLNEMGEPTGEVLPAEYEVTKEDITAQVEAEKAKHNKKKKDRGDRVTSLKAIDWSKINSIVELKAIVKALVDDNLKDEV